MAAKSVCTIEGCGKRVIARGWCHSHYKRWRLHGDPQGGRERPNVEEYYQTVVLPYEGDDCLFWPFAKATQDGRYAIMIGPMKKKVLVHRRLCEEVEGPAPSIKHEATHSCGNGHLACVAKRHLSWKTHRENMADKILHGTSNRGSRNGLAKLNEHQVRRIKRRKGRDTTIALAKKYGVSSASISQIFTGKAWAWVE